MSKDADVSDPDFSGWLTKRSNSFICLLLLLLVLNPVENWPLVIISYSCPPLRRSMAQRMETTLLFPERKSTSLCQRALGVFMIAAISSCTPVFSHTGIYFHNFTVNMVVMRTRKWTQQAAPHGVVDLSKCLTVKSAEEKTNKRSLRCV